MMATPLLVAKSTVSEIMGAPEFPALVREYAREVAIAGMPPPDAKMALYQHLETVGMLHAFSAVIGGNLVGFISLLAPPLLHYGTAVAVSESFFVANGHRKSGAGLRLLRAAEDMARTLGSPGLLVSAPIAGRLAELLPHCGYTETSRVFFKRSAEWVN